VDIALLVVRSLLAAVFAVAGAAKLADLQGSRRAAAGFGVAPALVTPVGTLLPLVELTVAALLLPARTAAWGAIGAAALLAAFSAAIGRSIARGEAPDCHCFGQLHSEPAGWPTLGRNLALAAAAVFVVGAGWNDPGTSAVAWLGRLHGAAIGTAAVGGIAAVAALACAYLLGVTRRLTLRLDRLERDEPVHGLARGAAAPTFVLRDLAGEKHKLKELLAPGKPVLLVFVEPSCGPCAALLPEVGRWQLLHTESLTVVLVSLGKPEEIREKVDPFAQGLLLRDARRKAYRAYDAGGTPSAVLLTPEGRIDSATVGGARQIHGLVEERFGIDLALGLRLGEELPELTLPDLQGEDVPLASIRGRETLLLFWARDGDEAQELRDEIADWEAAAEPEPALVVVAPGSPDGLRDEPFRARILVDRMGDAWYAFGGYELPFAVLIGADGRVAWPNAAGAEHIMRLLRSSAKAPATA
jgi:peroxiredoxin